jgi:hypothetical protein
MAMRVSRLAVPYLACLAGVLGACALPGCASSAPYSSYDRHVLARTHAAGAIDGRPTYDLAWELPGHRTLMVPFAVEDERFFLLDQDVFTAGGMAGSGAGVSSPSADSFAHTASVRWHNAVFHDAESGEEWRLLDRRGVISRVWIFGRYADAERRQLWSAALVFCATLDDTNGDGELDDSDAAVAIVTDGDGRSPRRVTPASGQLLAAGFLPEVDAVQFRVLADDDGNGFSSRDRAANYWWRLGATGDAAPLLGLDSTRAVEALLR